MARAGTLRMVVQPAVLTQTVEGPLRHLESIAESMREMQVWPKAADQIPGEVAKIRDEIAKATDLEVES